MKFLLQKCSGHRRMSNTVHLLICFRPTVSLPDSPCPMSIASREAEIQLAIDRSSPSPAQQTYSAWNQCISERLFLILGYVLSIGRGIGASWEEGGAS